jgi:hypothetical protein
MIVYRSFFGTITMPDAAPAQITSNAYSNIIPPDEAIPHRLSVALGGSDLLTSALNRRHDLQSPCSAAASEVGFRLGHTDVIGS